MTQKYPLGLQDFEEIREGNYLYIDKTEYILSLVNSDKYCFLSRPRRFGKSLFISTLDCFFQGKKTLFKNLYIEDKCDWTKKNPVIRISFSNIGHSEKGLSKAIYDELNTIASKYEISLTEDALSSRLKELIHKLQPLGKVVILFDEYDKPILDYLGKNNALAIQNRDTLKAFYSVLKDADRYLEFVFITGVTKFSKVSIFSELNNLTDLTLHPKYGGICGITQDELAHYFKEELPNYDLAEIKRWYNGYTWDLETKVYNPFSLMGFFSQGKFKNFWFESGTPSFLVNLMLDYSLYNAESTEVDSVIISDFNIEKLNPFAVLFQAGYVTLADYDAIGDLYTLILPNLEVKRSLETVILNAYRSLAEDGSVSIVKKLHNSLKNNQLADLKEIFNTIFGALPYDLWDAKREKSYHAIIHLTFMLAGMYAQSEVHTTKGRLDAMMEYDDKIFLFEFKLNKSAEEALAQIETKDYARRFKDSGKSCIGIGINFWQSKREVEGIIWKEL